MKEHGFFEPFDPCLLSFELGYIKPDIEIYQHILKSLDDFTPDEILYVDDKQSGLDPAKELGLQTVLATGLQQTIRKINDLLKV